MHSHRLLQIEFADESPDVAEQPVASWHVLAELARKNHLVEEVVDRLGREVTLEPAQLFRSRLVVDEAVSNAIQHGSAHDPGAHITIELFRGDGVWVFRVRDSGPGFHRDDLPHPDHPDYLMREHGRGIMILERYCERVVYADGGRELTCWVREVE